MLPAQAFVHACAQLSRPRPPRAVRAPGSEHRHTYGLCFASIGTLVAAAVEKEATGVATGVNSVLRTLGGAIGAQIVAAVLIAHTAGGERLPDVSGYDVSFLLCTLFAAGAFAATLLIPRDRAVGVATAPALGAPRAAAS
ncbi:hypothetical protein [Sporichthya sp.]|uniref:hypothetical protein n=1 Tax=Sporichthya sp. TaxID=65475 RepID=UPI0017FCC5D4|nr:hypothetical protein [Sporichthya sp.]MBA3742703.1 hypothetical protein [Sporichthya sp.]